MAVMTKKIKVPSSALSVDQESIIVNLEEAAFDSPSPTITTAVTAPRPSRASGNCGATSSRLKRSSARTQESSSWTSHIRTALLAKSFKHP
jgi:hypothetical protein